FLHVGDVYFHHAGVERVDETPDEIVGHGAGGAAVLELHRDSVGLEHADPDGERPGGLLVAQDDDRHVGDRVHHESADVHPNAHGSTSSTSPRRLFGAAAVMRTRASRPSQADSPGMLTTVFPDVRPEISSSRRRLVASTSTSSIRPTAASCSCRWMSRCSAWSATIRRVFSASGTSSGIRLMASVRGRGEYLNEKMLLNRTCSTSDMVASKSSPVSPGKPTIM